MKLEPVAWKLQKNGQAFTTPHRELASQYESANGPVVVTPLYAIPDGYVVVPAEQIKDAERYQYLKSHPSFQHDKGRYIWYLPRSFDGRSYISLDECIDRALPAAKAES